MEMNAQGAKDRKVRVMVVTSRATPPQEEGDNRAWKVAEALSRSHDVILALPATTDFTHRQFAVIYYNQRNLGLIARDSDVVICDRDAARSHDFFTTSGSISPAPASLLLEGALGGAGPSARTREGDSDYYVWTPPEEKHRYGPSHYARRLRYYLRTGGVRFTAARALGALRRRLG